MQKCTLRELTMAVRTAAMAKGYTIAIGNDCHVVYHNDMRVHEATRLYDAFAYIQQHASLQDNADMQALLAILK